MLRAENEVQNTLPLKPDNSQCILADGSWSLESIFNPGNQIVGQGSWPHLKLQYFLFDSIYDFAHVRIHDVLPGSRLKMQMFYSKGTNFNAAILLQNAWIWPRSWKREAKPCVHHFCKQSQLWHERWLRIIQLQCLDQAVLSRSDIPDVPWCNVVISLLLSMVTLRPPSLLATHRGTLWLNQNLVGQHGNIYSPPRLIRISLPADYSNSTFFRTVQVSCFVKR